MNMPSVRIHGVNQVSLDSVSTPVAGPDDVIIKVALCGICGSDLSYIAMGGLGLTQPMPLGHELSGTVAAVGDNVSNIAIGERVVVNPVVGNNIGNGGSEGGFAPYLLVRNVTRHPQAIHRVPASLSDAQAAMVEPLSVALHGCHQGKAAAADKAVIFGAGPIGLGIAACLRFLGLSDIVVVDKSQHRLQAAQQLGAITQHADAADLAGFLMARHGQAELMGMPLPASDIYFEATGVKPVFEQITRLARVGARVVVVGVHKQAVELDLVNLLMRELCIVGSMAYPNEFPEVIAMLASGKVNIEPIISHRLPLSKFDHALVLAQAPDQGIKVLVDCQQ